MMVLAFFLQMRARAECVGCVSCGFLYLCIGNIIALLFVVVFRGDYKYRRE